jgi:hypothetical protein
MVIDMNETRLQTIEQLKEFLKATPLVAFAAHSLDVTADNERYEHGGRVRARLDYPQRSKRELGVMLAYLRRTSGCGRAQLALLVVQAMLVDTPDREGRYRINEVFCFNTAKRSTVEQSMRLSDVIVLDVRGLTADREGTGFEIGRLAHGGLLPRVVAVGDDATDWRHVDRLVRAGGQDPARLRRLTASEARSSDRLFEQLLQVAAKGRLPEPVAASA